MSAGVYFFCSLLSASPFLAIVVILVHYQIRRSTWKRKKGERRALGFCPSSAALGAVFLLATTFYRPRMEFAMEARLKQEVEEDDDGDPEAPEKGLSRQLRRIRRGEEVGDLELRI